MDLLCSLFVSLNYFTVQYVQLVHSNASLYSALYSLAYEVTS